jgi:hypothetical protein
MDADPNVNICLNIPAPTNGANKRQDCQSALLTYMCDPVSKQQIYDDGTTTRYVLAHVFVLPPTTVPHAMNLPAPDLGKFGDAVKACAIADDADGLIAHTLTGPSDWFKKKFTAASCDASATLYKPSDIIKTTGKPGDVQAGGCTP